MIGFDDWLITGGNEMIFASVVMASVAMLQVSNVSPNGRFGPYDNVVVEVWKGEARITAYGDAPIVRLTGPVDELKRCESAIRTQKATRCTFAGGTLTFTPMPSDRYRFVFSDNMEANVVDFDADVDALGRALLAMHTPLQQEPVRHQRTE